MRIIILVLGLSSITSASATVAPLKIASCEAMFLRSVNSLSTRSERATAAVQSLLRTIVAHLPNDVEDAGLSYDALHSFRSITRTRRSTAISLAARLSALHTDLIRPATNGQHVTLTFRGAQVGQALDAFSASLTDLATRYERQREGLIPRASELGATGIYTFYLAIMSACTVGLGKALIFSHPPGYLESMAMYVGAHGLFGVMHVRDEATRRDLQHLALTRALRKVASGQTKDRVLIHGFETRISETFASALFKQNIVPENARDGDLMSQAPSLVVRMLSPWPPHDGLRKAFVDHVAYVDPDTAEPVWVFTLRTFAGTSPSPRKPRYASEWAMRLRAATSEGS